MRKLKTNTRLFLETLLGRHVRMLLGRHVRALVVDTPEGLFAVDPEDHGVGGRLRRRGIYGETELARLRPLLDPGGNVLVVGAHVGTLAIPLARDCAHVTAIEANPRTFHMLKMNLALNGTENCRAIQTAVSDKPETISFQLARNNSGNSRRRPLVSTYTDTYDAPETITVDAVRLDDLLPGETYDLILMDIEGSECLALRGMPVLLQHARALAVEFTPRAIRDVAGADAESFVGLLAPHFDTVYIPSRDEHVPQNRFLEVLGGMYRRDEEDAGIVFRKTRPG